MGSQAPPPYDFLSSSLDSSPCPAVEDKLDMELVPLGVPNRGATPVGNNFVGDTEIAALLIARQNATSTGDDFAWDTSRRGYYRMSMCCKVILAIFLLALLAVVVALVLGFLLFNKGPQSPPQEAQL